MQSNAGWIDLRDEIDFVFAQRVKHMATYPNHGRDRSERMAIARFDLPTGKKEIRPFKPVTGGWSIGDPAGLLPLYRLPDITDGVVYVVEGEKCVDAARSIGLNATTSSHGSSSAKRSDWSFMAGREIIILPDRDDAGEEYADAVLNIAAELSPPAKVKVVRMG